MLFSHTACRQKCNVMVTLEYSTEKNGFKDKECRVIHKCRKCSYVTRSWFLLRNHMKRHQNKEDLTFNCSESIETYFCRDCSFGTFVTVKFMKHIKNHNRYETRSKSRLARHKLVKHSDDTDVQPKYKCKNCSYKTETQKDLKNHMKHKHSLHKEWLQCYNCNFKTISKRLLLKHVKEHQEKLIRCGYDYCSFTTKRRWSMRQHILYRHTADMNLKWFNCDLCLYKAKTKSQLVRHMIWKHTASKDIKWFYCDLCSYKAKHNYMVNRHVVRKHVSSE